MIPPEWAARLEISPTNNSFFGSRHCVVEGTSTTKVGTQIGTKYQGTYLQLGTIRYGSAQVPTSLPACVELGDLGALTRAPRVG